MKNRKFLFDCLKLVFPTKVKFRGTKLWRIVDFIPVTQGISNLAENQLYFDVEALLIVIRNRKIS